MTLSVCVIGAGPSGLPALKAALDAGFDCDCYEKGEMIGGLWADTVNGAAYDSLVINTNKDMMQYADYPMPDEWPEYVPRLKIVEYFHHYAEAFRLNDHIFLNHEVTSAKRKEQGGWSVTVKNIKGQTTKSKEYDILLVANGHHGKPKLPAGSEYPGLDQFTGIQMHSHEYQSPLAHDLKGKRVLVVGGGNSAMDIACELGNPGLQNKVVISMRRGVYVWPKWVLGKPTTLLLKYGPKNPPRWYSKLTGVLTMWLFMPNLEKFGMPKPDHACSDTHPTISDNFAPALRDQKVIVKPGLKQVSGNTVTFQSIPGNKHHAHETQESFDVIIWCTGYYVHLPFLDKSIVESRHNYIPLWHRMIKPGIMDLAFIGLFQPLGAVMPLAEAQAKLYMQFLKGEVSFPVDYVMETEIERRRKDHNTQFYQSDRHAMEEFQYHFLDVLQSYSAHHRDTYTALRAFSKEPLQHARQPVTES